MCVIFRMVYQRLSARRRGLFCLLLFIGFGLSRLVAQSGATPEALKLVSFTLPNGFAVYINEDPHASEVYGAVAVRAGGKYDPKDATGMGHYLEHMLFKGTDRLGTYDYAKEKPLLDQIVKLYDELGNTKEEARRESIQKRINELSVEAAKYAVPNEMDRLLSRIGSKNVNAFTSQEAIVYYNSFPAHQIGPWLDLYAHRFQNPVFRLFQSELETVYEEKNRSMDNYGSVLFETFAKHFYKNHPYGQQTILGETEHLKNPSLSKMQAYYDAYYVPNNMALLLTGPISADEVRPMIERLFGGFQPKSVPAYPKYEEKPFNGRETVKIKVSPVKILINGWRGVPVNHPDELALKVCAALLSNGGETGLLDRLRLDNKVLYSSCILESYVDHGGIGLYVLPKLVGQSFAEAERLVHAELENLRQGRFSDTLYEAVITNLIRDHELGLESSMSRGLQMLSLFIERKNWDDIVNFGSRVRGLSKADVQRVAQKYFTENYLALESGMGFPKKDKLKKPPFVPVSATDNVQSEYASHFAKLTPATPRPRFIDADKEVSRSELAPGRTLYRCVNPVNELCGLTLKFGLGTTAEPLLELAASYLQQVGSEKLEVNQFKQNLYALGYTCQFYASKDYFNVSLVGPEDRLREAVALIRQLFDAPAADDKALKIVKEQYRSSRKVELGEAPSMAEPLNAFMVRGNMSHWLRMPDRKQLNALSTWELIRLWRRVQDYETEIHYTGRRSENEVKAALGALGLPSASFASNSPVETPLQKYSKPTVYYFPRKDARQSQIYFYVHGKSVRFEDIPLVDAFNAYFGGDMSSLVFQEVREFRSLAYSAYGSQVSPKRPNNEAYLSGYVGCQADKTLEAIEVMKGLIENTPEKREREAEVRDALVQQAYTQRPEFRYLSEYVAGWRHWGYHQDPAQLKLAAYQRLDFDRMMEQYKRAFAGEPVSIAIVANPRDVKPEELAKFGKVIKVKREKFYAW